LDVANGDIGTSKLFQIGAYREPEHRKQELKETAHLEPNPAATYSKCNSRLEDRLIM
jgi:hypothetical protein